MRLSRVVLGACLVLGATLVPGGSGVSEAASPSYPNILFVVTDDQPLGAMSALPMTERWIAERGREYTNAIASTPVCCPSRASMLTGRYAHNHGVLRNGDVRELDLRALIARPLQAAGYRTGVFGKFLNGWNVNVIPPFFHEWAIIPKSKDAYRNGTWNVNGAVEEISKYGPNFVAEQTLDFIAGTERRDGQPWFAYVATPAPHAPYFAHPRYRSAEVEPWSGVPSVFEDDPAVDPAGRTDKPEYVRASDNRFDGGARVRRKQLRSLMSVDEMMASFRRELRRLNEMQDTLVIFVSDNGFMWAHHGLIKKFVPYLESIRVPLLIRWPAEVAPGSIDDRIVSVIDLAPTMLDAAGLEEDPRFPMDGRSLFDLSWNRERVLIESWRDNAVPTWAGFFAEDYTYVEYFEDDSVDSPFSEREFYDLVSDPYQLRNLLGDIDPSNDPGGVQMLSDDLRAARTCAGPGECP